MTAPALAQSGSRHDVAMEAADGGQAAQRTAGMPTRDAATAAMPTPPRCSPDPCQHTDRYRLVTPFSLRL